MSHIRIFDMDIALTLAYMGVWNTVEDEPYAYSGDVSENDETAYDALTWMDARPKPTWADVLSENYNAHMSEINESMFDHHFDDRQRLDEAEGDVATLQSAVSSLSSSVSSVSSALGGKQATITAGAAISNAAADANVGLGVLNILNVHTEINASNTKQNALATKFNQLLAVLRAQGLLTT